VCLGAIVWCEYVEQIVVCVCVSFRFTFYSNVCGSFVWFVVCVCVDGAFVLCGIFCMHMCFEFVCVIICGCVYCVC